ncbi:nucleotide exchange factor GrpE [Companilactobacillus sp. RD055328]|uniref:nucleotide exchange factor GrpE n=1 Tax=Companilactobacillus sp. RD055328 TaxID=2916634 RepID=UPI001FC872B6|nr:nucleotide exchange factor GrpE [Companilactobacillus sp. RD055328]
MDSSQFPSEDDIETKETVIKNEEPKDKSDEVKEEVTDDSNDELEALQKQKDEFEDKYLRSQAEIQNMHARFDKEKQQLLKYDGQKLAKEILPVIDNIERALQVEVTNDNGEQLKKGIELTLSGLNNALKDSNVTEIAAEGETFDPNVHQAIQTVAADDEHPVDTVVSVLQKGYMLKDRVLRPSMVIVAN